MSHIAHKLFESEGHTVYLFTDLVKGDGIQANQLFIENNHHSALFDPGGALTYQPLSFAISKISSIKELDYIFASHQDPDIISSIDKWIMYSDAKVVVSRLWERFLLASRCSIEGQPRIPGYSRTACNELPVYPRWEFGFSKHLDFMSVVGKYILASEKRDLGLRA